MARNKSGGILGYLVLGTATVAGCTALGYFVLGGAHPGRTTPEAAGIEESAPPVAAAPAPASAPRPPKRVRLSSDYTAPGAPRIHIVESRTPALDDSAAQPHTAHHGSLATDTTNIPTPDAEASQQGDNTSSAASPVAPASDTTPRPSSSSTDAHGTSTTPSAGATPSTSPDPEASQTGESPAKPDKSGPTQYRVQAGAFADSKNAHDYVGSLHDKGYDANVRPERKDGKTVYKVQVGAYRDRTSADGAAADFRRNGVPATVNPVNP